MLGKYYMKHRTFTRFTFNGNAASKFLGYPFDVAQTNPKPFYIMNIARRDTVKFLENPFQRIGWDPNTVITNAYSDPVPFL